MTDYSGYSGEGLLQVLMEAGGDREKVDDPENFKTAWEIIHGERSVSGFGSLVIEGITFEIPPPDTSWSLYPLAEIDQDTDDGVIQRVHDLWKLYEVPLPDSFETMSPGDVRAWVREVSQRADLKKRADHIQDETRLRSLISGNDTLTRMSDTGRVHLIHTAIAQYIHSRLHTLAFNGQIYIYDQERGYYRLNAGDVEEVVNRVFILAGSRGSNIRDKAEVLSLLKSMDRHLEYPFNKHPGMYPVLNGILTIDYTKKRVSIIPHTPEYRFNYRLPVRYDPRADTKPMDDILQGYVSSPEELTLLYQCPAQALLQTEGRIYKKAYVLKGPRNAGKSSYLEILSRTIGTENISGESLQGLSERFSLASLEGKILNVYDDLDKESLKYTGLFKKLTGGEEHVIERKRQTRYKAVLTAVHVFSANELPQIAEKDAEAFWGRWEIIIFSQTFQTDGNFYGSHFTPEVISGFFIRILTAMVEIVAGEGLFHSSSPEEVQETWLIDSDPKYSFFKSHLIKDSSAVIPKEDLWNGFEKYCKVNSIESGSEEAFWRTIKRFGVTQSRPIIAKKRVYCYQGYRWSEKVNGVMENPYYQTYETGTDKKQKELSFISGFNFNSENEEVDG